MEDDAEYTCLIKKSSSKAYFHVEAAPKLANIDKFKDTIVLKSGASALIEVPFSCSPQPTVTWEYNDRTLEQTTHLRIDVIKNMTSLIVSRAVKKDAGTYKLTLENKFGKVILSVKIKVMGKLLLNVLRRGRNGLHISVSVHRFDKIAIV